MQYWMHKEYVIRIWNPYHFYYGSNMGLNPPPPIKRYIALYLSNQKLQQADVYIM